MLPASVRSKNRIELETEILCATLRQSWANEDWAGAVKCSSQLNHLFPDLVAEQASGSGLSVDYYQILGLKPHATAQNITTSFLASVRSMLKIKKLEISELSTYHRILDAGFILRKPRLRLSHDLVCVRSILQDKAATPSESAPPAATPERLPELVAFMHDAAIIGLPEVQALTAQLSLAPEIPAEQLVVNAGYATLSEMKAICLGQSLVAQGKVTMAQFQVAFYDERNSGVRMAESLQVRGWLTTQSNQPGV